MSYYRDPHTGHQIRAFREGATGRYNPICLDVEWKWYEPYLLGALGTAAIAIVLWAALA